MISLQPREQFTLVRQLEDHTDLTTYYVQAVVRNSVTGEIIKTINLTDEGNGRFTKIYEVPSDISGLGFYIDITISVYTDSGYTTKASSYGDNNDQFLVFDRTPRGGGGGGADVDYKKIQKMMDGVMKAMTDAMPKMDIEPMMKMMADIKKEVGMIEMPEMEKMDHTPVLKAIGELKTAISSEIKAKAVTPITDLSGLEKTIVNAIDKKEPNLEKIFTALNTLHETLVNFIEQDDLKESAKDRLLAIKAALQPILGDTPLPPKSAVTKRDEIKKKLLGGS